MIVVAIDLHKGSNLVMSRALSQSALAPSNLHVVCISEPNIANVKPPEDLGAVDLTGPDLHRIQQFSEQSLAAYRKKSSNTQLPSLFHHHDTGDPAEKIVALAAKVNADLVILGTHGRTGIKRLLLGSVAEKVVRLAGCPVLVVREKKHDAQ